MCQDYDPSASSWLDMGTERSARWRKEKSLLFCILISFALHPTCCFQSASVHSVWSFFKNFQPQGLKSRARLPRGYGFFAEFRCLQEMFKLFINVSQNDFLSFGLFYWYFILTFTRFWVIMILPDVSLWCWLSYGDRVLGPDPFVLVVQEQFRLRAD